MWRIEFHSKVRDDVKGIPEREIRRIKLALELLKENPETVRKKPLKGYENFFAVRVGDYRIIIEVNFREKLFKVWMIEHRKKVYDKMKMRIG